MIFKTTGSFSLERPSNFGSAPPGTYPGSNNLSRFDDHEWKGRGHSESLSRLDDRIRSGFYDAKSSKGELVGAGDRLGSTPAPSTQDSQSQPPTLVDRTANATPSSHSPHPFSSHDSSTLIPITCTLHILHATAYSLQSCLGSQSHRLLLHHRP